jgi:hypothetical protein
MEFLRERDQEENNKGYMPFVGSVTGTQTRTNKGRRKRKSMSKVRFHGQFDFEGKSYKEGIAKYESMPSAPMMQPYWLLRCISGTIKDGGFLTPSIYVPKLVWTQYGAKFSGLSAKMSAFSHVITGFDSFLGNLSFGDKTIMNLERIHLAFESLETELLVAQNDLAKPFPFVQEVIITDETSSGEKSTKTGGGARLMSGVMGALGSFGKSVRKMAEVGYSRLGAITSRATEEEAAAYSEVILTMCDKCQLMTKWFDWCLEDVQALTETTRDNPKAASVESQSREPLLRRILAIQMNVAAFFQETVCQLLLRDVDQLLLRYMRKMRKSFSRLDWDDDEDDEGLLEKGLQSMTTFM